jgi:DNA invertase Pin-like site-specific DNA recombinase
MKTANPKAPAKPAAKPRAYSYVRFSTPEQRQGDSLRRQTEATQSWCERHNVSLDVKLTLRDLGVSAFKGRHRSDKAALGQFLEAVKLGKVPKGSYLIIENLDRLSREDARTALSLWISILDAGVNIVQLNPERVFRHEKSDMMDVFQAVIELSRGHSESLVKSQRIGAAWAEKRKQLRATGEPLTRRLPAWIEAKGGTVVDKKLRGYELVLNPERVAIVRRIFEMTINGIGQIKIAETLIEEGVKPWGPRTEKNPPRWLSTYVGDILRDRRAMGEIQLFTVNPDGGKLVKDGPPIKDYYPAAVTEEEFYLAQACTASRNTTTHGKVGDHVNIFQGLLYNARDVREDGTHGRYHVQHSMDRRRAYRVLGAANRREGGKALSFPLDSFERAILHRLREVDPAELLEKSLDTQTSATLEAKLQWVRGSIEKNKEELLRRGVSPTIAEVIRDFENTEQELVQTIKKAKEVEAKPLAVTWTETKSLLEALDQAPDVKEARLRLRLAIRRIVQSIYMLVIPHNANRYAWVQINFEGGGVRFCEIYHRRASRGHAARCWMSSTKHVDLNQLLDIRKPEGMAQVLRQQPAFHEDSPFVAFAQELRLTPIKRSKVKVKNGRAK